MELETKQLLEKIIGDNKSVISQTSMANGQEISCAATEDGLFYIYRWGPDVFKIAASNLRAYLLIQEAKFKVMLDMIALKGRKDIPREDAPFILAAYMKGYSSLSVAAMV